MKPKMKAPPEAQKQYDLLTTAALGILYGDLSKDMVVQKLRDGESELPETIAHTAKQVLKSVVGGVEKQNRMVPPVVANGVLIEIVAELIEIAQAAKLVPEQQAKELAKQAMILAKQPDQPPQPQQPQQPGLVQQAMGA